METGVSGARECEVWYPAMLSGRRESRPMRTSNSRVIRGSPPKSRPLPRVSTGSPGRPAYIHRPGAPRILRFALESETTGCCCTARRSPIRNHDFPRTMRPPRCQTQGEKRTAMSEPAWDDAISRIRGRIEKTARPARKGFPHFADPRTRRWTRSSDGDWTGGYFNAMLWLGVHCGAVTDRERWLEWARGYTERLRPRLASDSSSRALLFYYGAALGSILEGDRSAHDLALEAAEALAAMYNPRAGVLPLGGAFEEFSNVGVAEAEVDMVQAVALLMWACRESGDQKFRTIATSHARRHIEFCLRPDGSICQSASFDPETGAVLRRY